MKKMSSTLLVCLLAVLANESHAQWNLAGNNNATASSILGTTNSIPLSLATKNVKRLIIDTLGRIGIGTTTPVNILTVKGTGSTPAASWVSAGVPLFVGFGETTAGNADFILGMGAAAANSRPVFVGRKSRGTLATPTVVATNDYLMSFLASGYDGSAFQNPAAIDFYVDGTPSAGNVPARISFITGSNGTNRAERLKIGSSGDINITTGNLIAAKKVVIKGIAGINGDTLSGNALYVNADTGMNGINVKDPGNNYVLYSKKSGENDGILIMKTAAVGNGTPCIEGIATGNCLGVEGRSETNVGVFAASSSSYGLMAFNFGNNSYAGYFNGSVYTSGLYQTSDAHLKKDIRSIENGMQIINQLQPKTYNFRDDGLNKKLCLPKGNHYGLLAQDLEKILPQLVKDAGIDSKYLNDGQFKDSQNNEHIDFKAVNYTELIPIMLKGMQELSTTNEQLKKEMADLKGLVMKLLNGSSTVPCPPIAGQ